MNSERGERDQTIQLSGEEEALKENKKRRQEVDSPLSDG